MQKNGKFIKINLRMSEIFCNFAHSMANRASSSAYIRTPFALKGKLIDIKVLARFMHTFHRYLIILLTKMFAFRNIAS